MHIRLFAHNFCAGNGVNVLGRWKSGVSVNMQAFELARSFVMKQGNENRGG